MKLPASGCFGCVVHDDATVGIPYGATVFTCTISRVRIAFEEPSNGPRFRMTDRGNAAPTTRTYGKTR